MRAIIIIMLAALAVSSPAIAQSGPAPPAQSPQPEIQKSNGVVTAISANTGRRLWIWVKFDQQTERPFSISPDLEYPFPGSTVLSLLIASYQTQSPVLVYYTVAAQPDQPSKIVRVDTLRKP